MTQAVATTNGTAGALALVRPTQFSGEQIATMKATVAKNATDHEFALLLEVASKYDLDPFTKEIWCIKRSATDAALIMTSRDGYLKIAQRNPDFNGIQSAVVKEGDHFEFQPDTGLVIHRFGAKRGAIQGAWCIVHHKKRMPVSCYVEFGEYKGSSPIWSKYPSAMIQKVAEVFALKRQFGVSGLVTQEEMDHPGMDPAVQAAPPPEPLAYEVYPEMKKDLQERCKAHGVTWPAMLEAMSDNYGTRKLSEITASQFVSLSQNIIPGLSAKPTPETPKEVDAEWESVEDPIVSALKDATPPDEDFTP